MKVRVKYFAGVRQLLGGIEEEEYEVENSTTLMELLHRYIPERHGGYYWIPASRHYMILINNSMPKENLKHELKDKDVVAIFPSVGGG